MTREYVIYADESIGRGEKFSRFYGGCLVESRALAGVVQRLETKVAALQPIGELKWQKVTAHYIHKYIDLIDAFFDEVEGRRVKVRIFFTQNRHDRSDLTQEDKDQGYFKLYYQFLKHAFGLQYSPPDRFPTRVRLLLDDIPDQRESKKAFKDYLASLSKSPLFRKAGLIIEPQSIQEVRSHDHVLLQCVDVVLGAMQFRLNELHLERTAEGKKSNRAVAKETLYDRISERIRRLRPSFNIGISTGTDGNRANRWHHPYAHWLFRSVER